MSDIDDRIRQATQLQFDFDRATRLIQKTTKLDTEIQDILKHLKKELRVVKKTIERASNSYNAEDLETANTMLNFLFLNANFLTIADTYKKSLEKEKLKARYDALTNIGSRRLFNERIEDIEKNLSRYHQKGIYPAIFLIDADQFKATNDHPELGHNAGDAALKTLASLLKKQLRTKEKDHPVENEEQRSSNTHDEIYEPDQNIAFRQGGDEFASIYFIVAESIDEAEKKAEQIKYRIREELKFAHFEFNNNLVPIGFSIGEAVFKQDHDTIDEADKKTGIDKLKKNERWVLNAKKLKNTAKEQGKNMIVPRDSRGSISTHVENITINFGESGNNHPPIEYAPNHYEDLSAQAPFDLTPLLSQQ